MDANRLCVEADGQFSLQADRNAIILSVLCGKIWLSLFLHGMDCDTAHSAGKKKKIVVMNGGIAF